LEDDDGGDDGVDVDGVDGVEDTNTPRTMSLSQSNPGTTRAGLHASMLT
jgi:hypothetical protein